MATMTTACAYADHNDWTDEDKDQTEWMNGGLSRGGAKCD